MWVQKLTSNCSLHELLDDGEEMPQFAVNSIEHDESSLQVGGGGAALDTDDWGARYEGTAEFTASRPQRMQSVESIFGAGIDESAIVRTQKRQNTADFAAATGTVEVREDGDKADNKSFLDGGKEAEATIDRWGVAGVSRHFSNELQTGAGGLDSQIFDTTTTASAKPAPTNRIVADMSILEEHEEEGEEEKSSGSSPQPGPQQKTTRVVLDMSMETGQHEVEETAPKLAMAPTKTMNVVMDMSLDQSVAVMDGAGPTVNLVADMSLDAPTTEHQAPPTKTMNQVVNMSLDMSLQQPPTADMSLEVVSKARKLDVTRTTNFLQDMSMEVSDAGAENEDLNRGFTKDWARTDNFAAPMEIVAEEEEEEDEVQQQQQQAEERDDQDGFEEDDDDEVDDVGMQWGARAFDNSLTTVGHLAAADAARKSLEMGEIRSRKSVERASLGRSPARLSLDPPRESLNRSSLLLSPVEETASLNRSAVVLSPVEETADHDDASPEQTGAQKRLQRDEDQEKQEGPQQHFPTLVPPVAAGGVEMPTKRGRIAPPTAALPSSSNQKEQVIHPLAGCVVNAPISKLPGLFDRRYSSRQIIRNFGRQSEGEAMVVSAQTAPPPTMIAAPTVSSTQLPAPFKDAPPVAVQESYGTSHDSESLRRISTHRQSMGAGELALADFLFLAQVKFVEEAPMVYEPFECQNSARSIEVQAMEEEYRALMQISQDLRAAIEQEEEERMSSSNPLFAAVTTSDQTTLHDLQQNLSQLKRVCIWEAEAHVLRGSIAMASTATRSLRQLGETAMSATRSTDHLVSALRSERESLRKQKMDLLTECGQLRQQAQARKKSSNSISTSHLSATQALMGCKLVRAANRQFEVELCGALSLRLDASKAADSFSYELNVSSSISDWTLTLLSPLCKSGTKMAPLDANSLGAVIAPIYSQLVQLDAVLRELRILSRRFNVVYEGENMDIYFSSKSALVLLQIPLAALRGDASSRAAAVKILKTSSSSSTNLDGLFDAVSQGFNGVNGLTNLCARVWNEFAKL